MRAGGRTARRTYGRAGGLTEDGLQDAQIAPPKKPPDATEISQKLYFCLNCCCNL